MALTLSKAPTPRKVRSIHPTPTFAGLQRLSECLEVVALAERVEVLQVESPDVLEQPLLDGAPQDLHGPIGVLLFEVAPFGVGQVAVGRGETDALRQQRGGAEVLLQRLGPNAGHLLRGFGCLGVFPQLNRGLGEEPEAVTEVFVVGGISGVRLERGARWRMA